MIRAISVLVCLFILATSANALSLKNKDRQQIINLESTNLEYNLGSVGKDKIINRTIKIRNKLEETLVISKVRSTCECIKIYAKPQILDRGGIFEIEIAFDTTGINYGTNVEEVVYILTDNMDYEFIRLVILATIVDSKPR
ncbi:MAG: DUF1573 domain-containing protein [Candidatus Omnitrophica bacterium]|nr:DUF1573 domain-containing protein [Candidatus Omnitrophota bacterium]